MGKGLYNTKVKVYTDGTTNITYCSSQIFGEQQNRFLYDTDSREETLEADFGYDEGILTPHLDNIDTEMNREVKERKIERLRQQLERIEKNKIRPDNVKRAKDKVFDIVYQNEFAYFLTITLSKDNGFDRENPQEVLKKLSKWLNNQQQRRGLKYILIPELHEKGGIHCHALVNDVFTMVDSGRVMYQGHTWNVDDLKKRKIYTGGLPPVYNIKEWKYGWSTAISLYGERMAIAHYMTKYITKDLKKIFGKYYWSSRSCIRDTEVLYTNTDYDSLNLREFTPTSGVSFKYEGMTYSHSDNVESVVNPETVRAWEQAPQIDYSNLPWADEYKEIISDG